MMTVTTDHQAGEIVIHTDYGMVIVNECQAPNVTRIVVLPNQGGLVTNAEGAITLPPPAMLCIWGPVGISEPDTDPDDTQFDMQAVGVYDDLEVGD